MKQLQERATNQEKKTNQGLEPSALMNYTSQQQCMQAPSHPQALHLRVMNSFLIFTMVSGLPQL